MWGKRGNNKYNARKVVVDGIRFDSKAEANRYSQLALLQKRGQISGLELQPRFYLWVAPININASKISTNKEMEKRKHPYGDICIDEWDLVKIGYYTADFRYRDDNGKVVIEDVKSWATAQERSYRLRKRLVEALYGIEIREVAR